MIRREQRVTGGSGEAGGRGSTRGDEDAEREEEKHV